MEAWVTSPTPFVIELLNFFWALAHFLCGNVFFFSKLSPFAYPYPHIDVQFLVQGCKHLVPMWSRPLNPSLAVSGLAFLATTILYI